MSYSPSRKRRPPMSPEQIEFMFLLSLAQTVGARRSLALAKRDGKLNDDVSEKQRWAALAEAKKDYVEQRDKFLKRYGMGSMTDEKKVT